MKPHFDVVPTHWKASFMPYGIRPTRMISVSQVAFGIGPAHC
jgi:hypothetical protein